MRSGDLNVRLLGRFGATVGSTAVVFPTRKAAALLALLARRPAVPAGRERIAALLWPRADEAQARSSLRQAAAQLRRALGVASDRIVSSPDTLALTAEGVDVDVVRLERALTDGDTAALTAAAPLYVGDFLDDLALREEGWEEWRTAEARSLRARTLAALTRLVQALVEAGDDEAALATGERVLTLEPTQEEVHRALMTVHLRRGGRGSAMRQYERCRAALEADLGVRPSAATQAVREQIVAPAPDATDAPLPSVAVLPFASLSGQATDRYAALGFAEDLIGALSRFRSLRVIARHSSFFPIDRAETPAETGRRLGARYVVTGTVRRLTSTIRVGVELIDAATGHYVWTHRYNVDADGIFDSLADITRHVVGALAPRIDEAILASLRRKPLAHLSVYDCWLKALEGLRRGTFSSHAEARVYLERALERDPDFARAYAGMSLTHFNEWSCHAWDRWEETASEAQRWAEEAVRRDDTDHVTHMILGRILLYRRDFQRAAHHVGRAETLNPNDADMLTHAAMSHALLGDAPSGIERARTALALNPLHEDWYFLFAAVPHYFGRDLARAVELTSYAPDMATDARAFMAMGHTLLGRRDEADRQRSLFMETFRRNITHGRPPAPDEPVRWMLRTNPMRRPEDREFLLDGLARAGFTIPSDPERVV